MSIPIGISGAVRDVSSVKCGVNGVVRNVTHGYNGWKGIRRQFFGNPAGIQYFMALPAIISYGADVNTEIKPQAWTFVSQQTSGNYTVYNYKTSTVDNMYVQLSLYKLNTRDYPRPYLADYVQYTLSPTANTSVQRGFYHRWSFTAVYDNTDFTGLDSCSSAEGESYSTNRSSWIREFKTTGKTPSVFTLNAHIYLYSNSGGAFSWYNPNFCGNSHQYSSWTNGETKTITTNQNASGTGNTLSFGALFYQQSSGTILVRVTFSSQTITLNGTNYPVYFSFAPFPH